MKHFGSSTWLSDAFDLATASPNTFSTSAGARAEAGLVPAAPGLTALA